MRSPLDNPVWASLTSLHAPLAQGDERARRYPADVAPFLAVPDSAGNGAVTDAAASDNARTDRTSTSTDRTSTDRTSTSTDRTSTSTSTDRTSSDHTSTDRTSTDRTGTDRARTTGERIAPTLTDEGLAALVGADTVLGIGPAPDVPASWQLTSLGDIVQMVCDAPIAPSRAAALATMPRPAALATLPRAAALATLPRAAAVATMPHGDDEPAMPGPAIVALGEADRPAVLALTALVYPHYFRSRTMELGRFAGIFADGALVAMVGERMGFPGYREISTLCTHPAHVGRGLGHQLLAHATHLVQAAGDVPFLHVSPANTRAIALYERSGYRVRTRIAFWSLQRATPTPA